MQKPLLTLALLAASLTTIGSVAASNKTFFETPSILGSKNFYIDLGAFSNNSGDLADNNDQFDLDFYNTGIKIGLKSILGANPESNSYLFATPYVNFGSSLLISRSVLTYESCVINRSTGTKTCNSYDVDNAKGTKVASSPTTAFGLELGLANTYADPASLYVVADVSKSIAGYKALGLGLKFGVAFRFGPSSSFFLDLGVKHFSKGEWPDLYKSNTYRYKQIKPAISKLEKFYTYSISSGFSF